MVCQDRGHYGLFLLGLWMNIMTFLEQYEVLLSHHVE